MNQEQTEQLKRDLTLMLIALTGWEEEKRGTEGKLQTRAWKGYNFEVLDDLQSKGLIYQVPGGKSLILKDRGIEKAMELIDKYKECG